MSKEQLEKEKDFIMLRASNYHYDLGVEHERERIIELIKRKFRHNIQFGENLIEDIIKSQIGKKK